MPVERVATETVDKMPAAGVTVHATAVVIGETGVLIRGRSGSGKSTLALGLLACAGRVGRFARLIGDDRVILTQHHGRVVARGVPAIAGLVELRGAGLLTVPFLPSAVVGLVVDSDVTPERLPDACDKMTVILETPLPKLAVAGMNNAADAVFLIVSQLESGQVWHSGQYDDNLILEPLHFSPQCTK